MLVTEGEGSPYVCYEWISKNCNLLVCVMLLLRFGSPISSFYWLIVCHLPFNMIFFSIIYHGLLYGIYVFLFFNRRHKKLKEEDIAICECKYDSCNPDSACGESCLNALTSTECTPGYCRCGEHCRNQVRGSIGCVHLLFSNVVNMISKVFHSNLIELFHVTYEDLRFIPIYLP